MPPPFATMCDLVVSTVRMISDVAFKGLYYNTVLPGSRFDSHFVRVGMAHAMMLT